MHPAHPLLLTTLCGLCLCACDSDSEGSSAAAADSPAAEDTAFVPTDNRFYNAAVERIQAGPPAVSGQRAQAIVDHMLEGDEIDLGEINSLELDQPEQNPGYLNEALEEAREATTD